MIPDAERLAAGMKKDLRLAFEQIYAQLLDSECAVYVKTIYVGFSIGAEMVAALYPRADCIEIALALPEDVEGPEFKDATHLTWPTMPVSVEVRGAEDLTVAMRHLSVAVSRVSGGEHLVRRPNEHFIGRAGRGNKRPTGSGHGSQLP